MFPAKFGVNLMQHDRKHKWEDLEFFFQNNGQLLYNVSSTMSQRIIRTQARLNMS